MFTVNQKELGKLKTRLAQKLQVAVGEGAEVLQDFTPIDTKRLWSTTRASDTTITPTAIHCDLVAGGLRVRGINREQDKERDVSYAIYVEIRQPYIRPNLDAIGNAIASKLTR